MHAARDLVSNDRIRASVAQRKRAGSKRIFLARRTRSD
jgi:hypothetical protein